MGTWDSIQNAGKPFADAADAQIASLETQNAALRSEVASLQAQLDAAQNGAIFNVTATAGSGEVTVSWSEVAGATGYTVGRDGTDTNGSGPWSTLDPATARSRVFNNLVNGTAYTFTVKPEGTTVASKSVTATPTGAVTPPPPTPPPSSGITWLSGVGDDNTDNLIPFGAFRGEPVKYGRVWGDNSEQAQREQWMYVAAVNTGFDGILDVAIGGPRVGWASAATGGWDSVWRQSLQTIRNNWGNLRGVHVSMAHEFNGNWYPWSVYGGDQSAFKSAWSRFYNIVQSELVAYGKNAKVVLSCNSDTVSGWTVASGLPNSAHFDILGVDLYDMWWDGGTLDTQAKWDANKDAYKGDVPKGIQAWQSFAASLGKPLSLPEWGVSPQPSSFNPNDPFFVVKMNEFFRANAPADPYAPGAGKIAGEAYFNAWEGAGRIYPSAVNVGAVRDQYTYLTWGS